MVRVASGQVGHFIFFVSLRLMGGRYTLVDESIDMEQTSSG